jgi:simple sugar transport system ATP-binding protein
MLDETAVDDGPYLLLRGITKQFPGCLANDRVDLTVARNEIHALLGENGAGKSTLVKIIYGVMQPDAGEIVWRGEGVTMQSPAHARRLGIGMVFQHFSLFESLTVAENVALGMNDAKDRANLRERIVEISQKYGLPLSPDQTVHDLSVGERQRIEIVRCLLQNPRLLIMDEPTSVLTPQEVEKLFETLRRLASEGCSILYISHKLEEIRALCDTATIMRLGRVVAHCVPSERSAKELAELMIAAQLDPPSRSRRILAQGARPRLAVENLSQKSPHPFGTDLREVGFAVSPGEILGVAGIAGNGQTELMDALSGEVLADAPETITLDGVAVGRMGPQERRNLGGCFVPEERNGHGAVGAMTLSENAFLTGGARRSLTRFGFINHARTIDFAREIIHRFDVRTTGPKAQARALSGGNLQKFLVGREVMQSRAALVVNQPTWGVDAGAAAAIYRALADLAEKGAAIVIISQDLDEIFLVCDRVAVIAGGRLSRPIPVKEATIEQIVLVMGGAAAKDLGGATAREHA